MTIVAVVGVAAAMVLVLVVTNRGRRRQSLGRRAARRDARSILTAPTWRIATSSTTPSAA